MLRYQVFTARNNWRDPVASFASASAAKLFAARQAATGEQYQVVDADYDHDQVASPHVIAFISGSAEDLEALRVAADLENADAVIRQCQGLLVRLNAERGDFERAIATFVHDPEMQAFARSRAAAWASGVRDWIASFSPELAQFPETDDVPMAAD